MQLFLKSEEGLLFSVLDGRGQIVYRAQGEVTPLSCRCVLCASDGIAAAHMTGVCLPHSFRCSVTQGTRHVQFYLRDPSSQMPLRFRGVPWRFRGSLIARSFDLVEEQPNGSSLVVMTHGRCWSTNGDCYAVTVLRPQDIPLALCVAVAVDSAAQKGCPQPVPAG